METRLCKGRFSPNRGRLNSFDELPKEKQMDFIEIKGKIKELLNEDIEMCVFGSFLKGYWDDKSDYDVVFTSKKPSEIEILKIKENIDFKVDIFFSQTLINPILIP